MSRTPAKAAKDPILEDIQTMRREFYKLNATLADNCGITPGALMMLLKEVSEDVYTAGIDKTFTTARLKDKDNVADAFDFSWLAVLAIRLNNYKGKS